MKQLSLLLCLFCSFHASNLIAQKEDENLKELFLDAEYFLLNEDYGEALSNYMIISKRGYQDNGNINYRIGQCYLNIPGEKDKAISYLEKATSLADGKYQEGLLKELHAPYDAYYYLGKAYRINAQFDKAIQSYEKYKAYYLGKDAERISLADMEIQACNFASEQIKNPAIIKMIKLGRPISTNNSDVNPVVSGDLNTLVYISKQKFYDAVYYSRRVNNNWTTPINITPEIQSDGDQYPTFLSYDGNELYLRKEDNFAADLLVSNKVEGVWTKSKSLGKNINSKYWEGNLSISKDGNILFFSSNRKEGMGAMDIYKSIRQPNGEWGVPVNLGSKLNTLYNEDAPYITEDGNRLYFISQGHKNMGGYDIFYSNILPDGQLTEPVNLGYPINSTDDDLYFYPLQNGTMAYTSLMQKGNFGLEDLFEIDLSPSAEPLVANSEKSLTEKIVEKTETAKPIETASVAVEEVISIQNEEPIILPTLFFDFNSWELSENSKKSLDYIVTVLKNYDNIKLQFTGHTDAMGSNQYNQALSEKRALASKNYLLKKGIAPSLISVKGMGEKVFIAINTNEDGSDNPEGRKFNRRVDIRVVGVSLNKKIIIEELSIPKSLKVEKP